MSKIDRPDWNTSAPSAGGWLVLYDQNSNIGASGFVQTAFTYVGNMQSLIILIQSDHAQRNKIDFVWSLDGVSGQVFTNEEVELNSTVQHRELKAVESPFLAFDIENLAAVAEVVNFIIIGIPSSVGRDVALPNGAECWFNQSVPANSNAQPTMLFTQPGRAIATLWAAAAGIAMNVQVWLDPPAAWINLCQLWTTAANQGVQQEVIIPIGDVRVNLINTTAGAVLCLGALMV